MSAEMWSGDMAEFEAAARRCPFLSSLGESALADIRDELAASMEQGTEVAEAAVVQEASTAEAAVSQYVKAEAASPAVDAAAEKLGHAEDAAGSEAPAFSRMFQFVTSKQVEVPEAVWLEAAVKESHLRDEEQVAAHESTPQPTVPEADVSSVPAEKPKSIAAPVTPPEERRKAATAPQEAPAKSSAAAELSATGGITESLDAGASETADKTGMVDQEDVELTVAEVAVPELAQSQIVEKLLDGPETLSEVVDLPVPQIEVRPEPQPVFSERLKSVITENVESERRPEVVVLVAKVYELAEMLASAPVPEGVTVDSGVEASSPALTVELERTVARLLEALGVAEPTEEQVQRFIRLVGQEVQATEPSADYWLDGGMHERLQGLTATIGYWLPALAHRLLGRLALLQPTPVE